MIHWAGGNLPWEKSTDPKLVQKQKETNLENISEFLAKCFAKKEVPEQITKLFKILLDMKYDTEPNYEGLRTIMLDGLKKHKGKLDAPLNFESVNVSTRTPKRKSTSGDNQSPLKKKKTPVKKAASSKAKVTEASDNVTSSLEPSVSGVKKRSKKVVKEEISDSEEEEAKKPERLVKKRKNKVANGEKLNGNLEKNGTHKEEAPENETAEMKKMRQMIEERKLAKVKKTRTKKII